MSKITLLEAKTIAEKLKKKYHFGTDKCPKWFVSVCVALQQDGSYDVSICVPSWNAIPLEDSNTFLQRMDGVWVGVRVVTPMSYISKKDKEKLLEKNDKVAITKTEKELK